MGTSMKTTIDLADVLFAEAKRTAAREGTTLRALIEEGLRIALDRRVDQSRFRLRDARFKGKGRGLHPEFARRGWSALREAAYDEEP
jgi:hypothetical protein